MSRSRKTEPLNLPLNWFSVERNLILKPQDPWQVIAETKSNCLEEFILQSEPRVRSGLSANPASLQHNRWRRHLQCLSTAWKTRLSHRQYSMRTYSILQESLVFYNNLINLISVPKSDTCWHRDVLVGPQNISAPKRLLLIPFQHWCMRDQRTSASCGSPSGEQGAGTSDHLGTSDSNHGKSPDSFPVLAVYSCWAPSQEMLSSRLLSSSPRHHHPVREWQLLRMLRSQRSLNSGPQLAHEIGSGYITSCARMRDSTQLFHTIGHLFSWASHSLLLSHHNKNQLGCPPVGYWVRIAWVPKVCTSLLCVTTPHCNGTSTIQCGQLGVKWLSCLDSYHVITKGPDVHSVIHSHNLFNRTESFRQSMKISRSLIPKGEKGRKKSNIWKILWCKSDNQNEKPGILFARIFSSLDQFVITHSEKRRDKPQIYSLKLRRRWHSIQPWGHTCPCPEDKPPFSQQFSNFPKPDFSWRPWDSFMNCSCHLQRWLPRFCYYSRRVTDHTFFF